MSGCRGAVRTVELIPFNVGGDVFFVSLSTLQKAKQSALYALAQTYLRCRGSTAADHGSVSRVDGESETSGSRSSPSSTASDDTLTPTQQVSAVGALPQVESQLSNATEAGSWVPQTCPRHLQLVPLTRRQHDGGKTRCANRRSAPEVVKHAIFIDRDPSVFRFVLRLLQGYAEPCSAGMRGVLQDEVVYYGLEHTWWRRFPLSHRPRLRFAGGGVSNADGTTLTSYINLSRVGEFMDRHLGGSRAGDEWSLKFSIEVELSEFVGVGVVSKYVDNYGADCRGIRGTAMYYNSGDVHWTPFDEAESANPHRLVGTSTEQRAKAPPYGVNAIVSVSVDVQRGTVVWEKNGLALSVVRLWKGSAPDGALHGAPNLLCYAVAGAVVLSGKSTVRLQPDEGVVVLMGS